MPNQNDYAILVGVEEYEFTSPLQGPNNDVNHFRALLLGEEPRLGQLYLRENI